MSKYTVILSPDPEQGGYSVTCPAAPGAVSQGETRDEALQHIAEALALWLDGVADDGLGPLTETAQLVADEVQFVLAWRAEEGWDLAIELAVVEPAIAVAA